MRRMRTGSLLALAGLLLGGAARADGDPTDRTCAEPVVQRVQAYYDGIADFRARFVQTRAGGVGLPAAPSEGEVVLSKPGRMRWSYEKPDPSLLVSDGEVVWMYDPLLEEAQRLPAAGGVLTGAAVRFLMGEGDLLSSFRVSAVDCDAEPLVLSLLPKTDSGYEKLALEVDAERGRVLASTVHDLFGNRTRVAFDEVRVNTSPDDALFRFSPPEGVEVFDLTPPPGAAEAREPTP